MGKTITKHRKVEYPERELEWLVPVPGIAEFFRVSEQTVRIWIREKKLKAYRLPPDDEDLSEIDINRSKRSLYSTRRDMAEWAEILYDL